MAIAMISGGIAMLGIAQACAFLFFSCLICLSALACISILAAPNRQGKRWKIYLLKGVE